MVVLAAVMAVAGCATKRMTFEKPGVAARELQRDRDECLYAATRGSNLGILTPHVDRDVLVRCMEARGYAVHRTNVE